MTILVSHARSVEDFVLLFGGPGCTGKSYFALELASRLAGAGSIAVGAGSGLLSAGAGAARERLLPYHRLQSKGCLLETAPSDIRSLD
jgi:hypothetical protein